MKPKKLLALALCLALSMALFAGCQEDKPNDPGAPENSANDQNQPADNQPEDHNTPDDDQSAERASVSFAVLAGPTGVGAAKLMADSEAGLTKNQYNMTVAAANDEVVAKLTGPEPEVDIAAMATNVAANLYSKTGGKVQLLTINGLGVLYILERDGETIQSIADLSGKTLYATGQGANPEYVLNYLLRQNGLEPGTDVEIVWLTGEEVTAKMVSGEAQFCMLPVPAATAVQIKAAGSEGAFSVRSALNLTEEWAKVNKTDNLVMSCTVVRTDWAKENPEAVAAFLEDYEASITYVKENAAEAAELVAQYGITPNAAIAQRAIPDCNLTFISGAEDVKAAVAGYYQVLFDADPASLGGAMPDDGFYYAP